MKTSETTALIARLKAAYPRQPIDRQTVAIYVEFLRDLEFSEAAAAVGELIASSRFFPTIAEIRELVARNAVGDKSAPEAWGEVVAEIRRVGAYGAPQFADPRVSTAVANVGGWRHVCLADEDQQGTLRAQFRAAYDAADRRVRREANAGRLLTAGGVSSRGGDSGRLLGDAVAGVLDQVGE